MNLTPQVTVSLSRPSKNRKDETATTESKEIDWDVVAQKAAIVQQTSVDIAKVAGIVYVAKKLIDTTCEIAVLIAKAKL